MRFDDVNAHRREGENGRWPMRLMTAVLALTLWGCGAATPKEAPPKDPTGAPPPRPSASASASAHPQDHVLARSAVRAVVARGLGAFLQHVEVDDRPVFVQGHFHGFSIAKLSDPPFWAGVDVRPGDVVISVNGLPIERPEQAQAAFESLATATELRVLLERDGQPKELAFPIADDR